MVADQGASLSTVAVVVPALNEARRLESFLPGLQRVLGHFVIPATIYVVDRGSADDTAGVAERLGCVVIGRRPLGYGEAIRVALDQVPDDYLITLDGDGSHPPELLNRLYRLREQADIVIASRYVPQGYARMGLVRHVLSRALNGLFKLLLDLPVHDLSSGYRLYNRRLVTGQKLEMSSYAVLQEILIKGYCDGLKIREIPMHYAPESSRPDQRFWRLGADYLKTFRAMWRLRNSTESCDYDSRAFFSKIPLQRYWQRRRYQIIRGYVGTALKVLDAGCGSTQILTGSPQIVGMDPQQRKLRFLRAEGRLLVCGSTFALPFKTAAFDVVISSQVIEHLPEDDTIFDELVRCLRPGGTLVLGTVDYGGWQWPLIEWAYSVAKPTGYADEHITHYTRATLFSRLRGLGLVVEDHQYILGGEIIIRARKPE